ncbi:hypothetical protein [Nocardia sp. NPDC127526]|uniref:hypothetical protein n=1 Tax=Nocardia sp. NPDC127526 TaxID=3345393 RepID=UPI003632DE2F
MPAVLGALASTGTRTTSAGLAVTPPAPLSATDSATPIRLRPSRSTLPTTPTAVTETLAVPAPARRAAGATVRRPVAAIAARTGASTAAIP